MLSFGLRAVALHAFMFAAVRRLGLMPSPCVEAGPPNLHDGGDCRRATWHRLPALNDREAARFFKLASDQGNPVAQVNLGALYAQGRGSLPKDDREAARLYMLAAEQGSGLRRAKPAKGRKNE